MVKKLTVPQLLLLAAGVLSAFFLLCPNAEAMVVAVDNIEFDGDVGEQGVYASEKNNMMVIEMDQIANDLGPWKTDVDIQIIGDTTFRVSKAVTNMTDFNWKGYEFILSGEESFFTSYAYCDVFGAGQVNIEKNKIEFLSEELLLSGDTAMFSFDVQVLNPEPATLVLFGLGALLMKRPRNK